LSFENKNPETKFKILFWTKKIQNWKIIHFRKKNPEKNYCVSGNKNEKPILDKKIRNIKFRSVKKNPKHIFRKLFLRTVLSFPLESGAGSNNRCFFLNSYIFLCTPIFIWIYKINLKVLKNLKVSLYHSPSFFIAFSDTLLRAVDEILSLYVFTVSNDNLVIMGCFGKCDL